MVQRIARINNNFLFKRNDTNFNKSEAKNETKAFSFAEILENEIRKGEE